MSEQKESSTQRSNIAMKRLALIAAFLALPLALGAQTTSPTASVFQPANGPADIAGQLYAANFAHWHIYPSQNGNQWNSASQCYGTSGGVNFPLFSTTAPITIVDVGVPANTETVTPTIATYNGGGCSVGLPATHAHTNYYLQSGTLGLQEALNWSNPANSVVVLTPDWTTLGGTTGMITAATAGAYSTILDCRTSQCIAYSGTTPAANTTGTGKYVLTTSPTIVTPTIAVLNSADVSTIAGGLPAASPCGTAVGCTAAAATANTIIKYGTAPLTSGSPSTASITGLPFTSSTSYTCTASPQGTTAAIAATGVAVNQTSGTAMTLTGPNTVSTVIQFICVGT
jgi:hypothetical protein